MSKILFFLFITATFLTTLFFSKVPISDNIVKESNPHIEGCDPPDFDIIGDHFIKVYEVKIYKTTNLDTTVTFVWGLTNDNNGTYAKIANVNVPEAEVNGGPVAGGRFWLYTTGTNGCGSHYDQGSVYVIDTDSPVDMLTFRSVSDKGKVTLNWRTENELNNSGFDVERKSIEPVSGEWQKIGFVEGNGTIILPVDYSFIDTKAASGKYTYRLKQIDYNGNFSYFELDNEIVLGIPEKFSLSQNYPNPFNPVTSIDFDLPLSGNVKLIVFDNLGRTVMTLLNEFKEAGHYKQIFDASALSSGTYFYRLETGNNVETKKMMLVK